MTAPLSSAGPPPDVFAAVLNTFSHAAEDVNVAVALAPRVLRAGRPFNVVVLLQNNLAVPVEVVVEVALPLQDAREQRARFLLQASRLVVGVAPGEVGYAELPATSLADVALSTEYRAHITLQRKAPPRAGRVRPAQPRPPDLTSLPQAQRDSIEDLQRLHYVTAPPGKPTWTRKALDVPFTMMVGTIAKPTDLQARWVRLWPPPDVAPLPPPTPTPEQPLPYRRDLLEGTLPKLRRDVMFAPLFQETDVRFAEGGFTLKPVEALLIAKIMTLVLEYATPSTTGHGAVAAGRYNVLPYLQEGKPAPAGALPHWLRGMIRQVEHDSRAADLPDKVIPTVLYDALLIDAVALAFEIVETASGDALGDTEERHLYAEQLVQRLYEPDGIDFGWVYLPLVLAGLVAHDRLTIQDERALEVIMDLAAAVTQRMPDVDQDDQPVLQLAQKLLRQARQRYDQFRQERP